MSSERHQKLYSLYARASELPDSQRAVFLAQACAGDAAMLEEVQELLQQQVDQTGFLDPEGIQGIYEESGLSGLQHDSASIQSPTETDGLLPRRVGKYAIRGILGRGGMGIVYLAEQERPKRMVALKVLRAELASKEAFRRFELESDILARIQHPAVAQIYESGTAESDDGRIPYFAMELVRGQPINQFVTRNDLNSAQRLELFVGVCDAVQFAHVKGVVHRDLKPSNILVTPEGRPKILDFGVARLVDVNQTAALITTQPGQLIGTLPYMSPEQVSGDPASVDTRSDVYSLGVVCYELLTGRLPYEIEGKSLAQLARIVSEHRPAPLSSVSRALRGPVESIVDRALQKEPSRRYQSANEFGEDIRRYLRGEPIAAQPIVVRDLIRTISRRHRKRLTWTTLVLVVGAGVALGAKYISAIPYKKLAEIQRLMDSRELQAAEVRLNALVQEYPRFWRGWATFARLKKEQYNDKSADTYRDRAVAQAGLMHAEHGLTACSDDSCGPALHNLRGVLLKILGRREQALQAYRQCMELDTAGDYPACMTNAAQVYALLSQLDEAEELLVKAVAKNSTALVPLCLAERDLAALQLLRGDERAVDSIENVWKCNKGSVVSDAGAYLLRSKVLLTLGGPERLEDAGSFAAAADVLPGSANPRAKRLRAMASLALGEYRAAIYHAEGALALDDQPPQYAHLVAAQAHVALGNPERARYHLDQAGPETWDPELSIEGGFLPNADEGLLWFESADELRRLYDSAESAVSHVGEEDP